MQHKSFRGVQQEEVFAAADAVLAEQQRPTIERVRLKLGRGSPNTVAPMLEAWFAALGERLAGTSSLGTHNSDVPAAVQKAATGLWKAALETADEQAQDALRVRQEALVAEQSELQAVAHALAQREMALTARETAQQESLDMARRQLEDQAEQIGRLQAQVDRAAHEIATSRAQTLEQSQLRSAERQRHEEQIRELVAAHRQSEERATAAEHRFLGEVDRTRQETKQAVCALQVAQQQLHEAREARRVDLTALEEALRNSELALDASKAQVVDLQNAAAKHEEFSARQAREFTNLARLHRALEVDVATKAALLEAQQATFNQIAQRLSPPRPSKSGSRVDASIKAPKDKPPGHNGGN